MKTGLFIVCLTFLSLLFAGSTSTVTRSTTPFNDSLFCLLEDQHSIVNTDFIRNELYTWTTKEQIATLRTAKMLLTKSESEKYGKAIYDLALEERKNSGNNIASFLLSSIFAKKRFAWPHPWATIRGYPGENYGDQLLCIKLKEEAIYGKFITYSTDTAFQFFASSGKKLDEDFVMAHPERIAVVYFVHSKLTTKKETVYRGTYSRRYKVETTTSQFPYREYVICNEGMIKEWSYGTQAIKNKIKNDLQYLTLLKEAIKMPANENNYLCRRSIADNKYITSDRSYDWDFKKDEGGCCVYMKTVALINEYYDLDEKQLKKTISILNSILPIQGDSIIVKN